MFRAINVHRRNQMSDEKETKDSELSKDELKQVTGGAPAVAKPVEKPPVDYFLKIDGVDGESKD
jgi:bacteriocin-like protein